MNGSFKKISETREATGEAEQEHATERAKLKSDYSAGRKCIQGKQSQRDRISTKSYFRKRNHRASCKLLVPL
jgi:hypothetical protein